MTEPGEVNGVRFLAGTIIDAQTHDADKLIRSGKAVRVDQDGNIIANHDDNSNVSDTPLDDSDVAAQALDVDASGQPASIDDSSVPAASDDASVSAKHVNDEAKPDTDAEANGDEAQVAKIADENPKEQSS